MFVTNVFHTPFSFLSVLFAFWALASFQAVGYYKISIGLESENSIGVADLISTCFEAMDEFLSFPVP